MHDNKYGGIGNMKSNKAWVVGELSVGLPWELTPWDKCRYGSKTNKQTKKIAKGSSLVA